MDSVTTGAAQSNLADTQDIETLRCALSSALSEEGVGREVQSIKKREPSIYASTFPSEILHCILADGTEQRIFCKYQIKGLPKVAHSHHGGIAHEARIYREILRHVNVSTPAYLGVHSNHNGQSWLFLEYLENASHLHKLEVKEGLLSAARWLGAFHAESEKRTNQFSFLTRFDFEYYAGWITRTLELTSSYQPRFPWLPQVCDEFTKLIELMLAEPLTLVHSEFYPRNILVCNGRIYPIDWESAAIGAGEIDLASLTEGWGPALEAKCESEYSHARWGNDPPPAFQTRAKLARAFREFRWLGDPPQWQERGAWRIETIGAVARELGILA